MTTLSPHTMSISPALPKPWSSLLSPWSLRPNGWHRIDSVSMEHSLGRQAQLCHTLGNTEISRTLQTARQSHREDQAQVDAIFTSGRGPRSHCSGVLGGSAMVYVVLRLSVKFSTHIWTLPEGPHLRDQTLFSFVWIWLKCHCITESAPEKQNQ